MAQIKTYCRIKPSPLLIDNYELTDTHLKLFLTDNTGTASTRSTRSRPVVQHSFAFSKVFDHQTQQSDIFDQAAKNIVLGFLDGFNGTIFAYGQTGSGKTHTVEGSSHQYDDRGLAPRAISMIYKEIEERTSDDVDFQISVSYMEIYQESGYDLLTTSRGSTIEGGPFQKVSVSEGPEGSCIIKNLSLHLASSKDIAQAFLSQGQTNRKVAETTMNAQSSRSHSIFTMQLTARDKEQDTITRSKLHLVDLAGSERVAKTGTQGRHLVEAKYINLSLHHLEGVIIALHSEHMASRISRCRPKSAPNTLNGRRARSGRPKSAFHPHHSQPKHVPYRNSLLTMVLRDSIGGNCQTAMIATVSMEDTNIVETLSTCRFAQRVACITNKIRKNEEIDDKVLIRRLRHRIVELEAEVRRLKTDQEAAAERSSPRSSILDDWELNLNLSEEDQAKYSRLLHGCLGGIVKEIMSERRQPLRLTEWLELIKNIMHTMKKPPDEEEDRQSQPEPPPEPTEDLQLRTRSAPVSAPPPSPSTCASSRILSACIIDDDQVDKFSRQLTSDPVTIGRPRSGRRGRRLDGMRMSQRLNMMGSIRKGSNYHKQPERETRSAGAPRARAQAQNRQPNSRTQAKPKPVEEEVSPEQRDLQLKQLHVQETQLQHIRKELLNGIKLSKEHINQQNAFLSRLREKSCAPELVTQEKVALKQLRRKQMRTEKRLKLIDEQLMSLNSIRQTIMKNNRGIAPSQDSEETLLKTRILDEGDDVLDSARSDQSKMLSCQKIGLKEAATRQRLMDFREKLHQARVSQESKNIVTNAQGPGKTNRRSVDEDEDVPRPAQRNLFGLSTAAIRLREQPQVHLPKPPARKSPTNQWSDVYSHKASADYTRDSLVDTMRMRRMSADPIDDPAYSHLGIDITVPTATEQIGDLPSARMEKNMQQNFSLLKDELMGKIAEYHHFKDSSSQAEQKEDGSSGYKSDSNPLMEGSDHELFHVDLEERWRSKLKSLLEQNPQFMISDTKADPEPQTKSKKGRGNFDDTLKQMLTGGASKGTKVTYPHDHYDTFARTGSKRGKKNDNEAARKEVITSTDFKKRPSSGPDIPESILASRDNRESESTPVANWKEGLKERRTGEFLCSSQQQRARVQRIRQVRQAAEVIQRHWRKHKQQIMRLY